jgi:hypothetical protein
LGKSWRQGNGSGKKLQNKELYNLYLSQYNLKIKSRIIRWVAHVADKGEIKEVHIGFSYRNLREGDHLEDLGIGGRTILNCIIEK